MAIELQGNVGLKFRVIETDTALPTGNIVQTHELESSVGELTLSATGLVASISGYIGVTAKDIDLNNLVNQSGADYDFEVVRNQNVDFTTISAIVFHNKSTNSLIVADAAATSFFPANEQRTVLAESGEEIVYPTPVTFGANGLINIVGSGLTTTFEMYIYGA